MKPPKTFLALDTLGPQHIQVSLRRMTATVFWFSSEALRLCSSTLSKDSSSHLTQSPSLPTCPRVCCKNHWRMLRCWWSDTSQQRLSRRTTEASDSRKSWDKTDQEEPGSRPFSCWCLSSFHSLHPYFSYPAISLLSFPLVASAPAALYFASVLPGGLYYKPPPRFWPWSLLWSQLLSRLSWLKAWLARFPVPTRSFHCIVSDGKEQSALDPITPQHHGLVS